FSSILRERIWICRQMAYNERYASSIQPNTRRRHSRRDRGGDRLLYRIRFDPRANRRVTQFGLARGRPARGARAAAGTRCHYSEADRDAPHVSYDDQAILIGPPPAPQSYLDGARIIGAARAAGAGAIHPGYGFLAENAAFAHACTAADLVFVGPPAEAMERMG